MNDSSTNASYIMNLMLCSLLTLLIVGGLLCIWFSQNGFTCETFPITVAKVSSIVSVHYIDVGQGDSIFIDTPAKDVLIDGGPTDAGSTVLNYLSSLSITRIGLMIATHAHEDHIGGLITILNSAITVDEILFNNQTYSSTTYANFKNLAQIHTLTLAQRGQTFLLTETANLTVMNPVQPPEFSNPNDNSVVVRLQVGSKNLLFTGDAEMDAEQSMISASLNLHSDILKVGHHGSRTATTQAFLDHVAPTCAIISAGEGNSYGHPHQETIQKLVAGGVTIYATYHSGTVVASTDGMSITFHGNPQSITEFPSSMFLSFLLLATTLIVIIHQSRSLRLARNPNAIQT